MRDDKIKNAWEKRSSIFKNSKRAVLEQSFPKDLLTYFHKKHVEEILDVIPKKKFRCLDIGCGYGRIAKEIILANPQAFVNGLDISPNFVDLFNSNLGSKGRGQVGNAKKLPYESNLFDIVIIVVSFMYLETRNDQAKAMREIFRVLKPGGKLVMIEPNKVGQNIIKLWGILPFIYRSLLRKQKVETFGIFFEWMTIDNLIKQMGGKLIEKKGYPFLTIALSCLVMLGKISFFPVGRILAIIDFLDKKITMSRFSYVVTYVAEKRK